MHLMPCAGCAQGPIQECDIRVVFSISQSSGLSKLVNIMLDDLGQPGLDTVRIMGKGRRERILPLWKQTTEVIRGLASGTSRSQGSAFVPERQGKGDEPSWICTSPSRACQGRCYGGPIHRQEAYFPAHVEALHGPP